MTPNGDRHLEKRRESQYLSLIISNSLLHATERQGSFGGEIRRDGRGRGEACCTRSAMDREALQMMRNFLARWRKTPGKRALVFWMFGSMAIARLIHGAFFGSDERLGSIFTMIAIFAVANAYVLIYKRRSPRDVLLSLGIAAAGFGAGIWISFAYLDADSRLSALPIVFGFLVASGVEGLIRKRFRKA